MEFKGIKKRDAHVSTAIDQQYDVSSAEIARARVGLILSGKMELLVGMPDHRPVKDGDSFLLRDVAELVVAGNLALIQKQTIDPFQFQLAAAEATVESGLHALAEGAEASALDSASASDC